MASRASDYLTSAANDPDQPARQWFTAAELAGFALPGLPADKRGINRKAQTERWSVRQSADGKALVRPRAGRGGGLEFHVSLYPGEARLELARRGICGAAPVAVATDIDRGGWRWFEAQSSKVKARAARRLAIVNEVLLLEQSGMTRTAAIGHVAAEHSLSSGGLWVWMGNVAGVAPHDRLPALADRHQGGGKQAEIDGHLWTVFLSDYLRPSSPTLAACYDRTAEIAADSGLSIPSQQTFRRRVDREIPRALLILKRGGQDKLRRSTPSVRRTVGHLHALEIVNIDGHVLDLRVTPPGGGEAMRPTIVAIQDVYSSMILAWCIDLSENSIQTQLAFRDLFIRYGLPKAVLLDNGRAFASKKITGGAKTRFRNKIKPDEPTGVLTALDINPIWALPYRGQSKPIERAWKEMCERISNHPATEGAYTGNSPANKPHNYGTRALGWDELAAHIERGIARHNAKTGRMGRHYNGRSFEQVFNESYATAPIRKEATPADLRIALLTAEQKRAHKETGEIELFGNRYWAPEMHDLAGQRVMVRFDPENLHSEIHVYHADGRFLQSIPLIEDFGFDNEAGAKASAKRNAEMRKTARRLEELHDLYQAQQVAELQDAAFDRLRAASPSELPEPTVIHPVRHRGQTAAALKAVPVRAPQTKEHEDRLFGALGQLKVVK